MPLAKGTRLSHYEIRSQIGAGGMGEVYLAVDTQLDRTVALKILPADVAPNAQRVRRFIQEAKAASALNHPHIITIHEVGQSDTVYFIATEFIDGATLRERMDPRKHNGGVFLGLNGIVVKSHGSANTKGVANAIHVAARMVRNDIIRKIGEDLDNFRAHAFANEAAQ